MQLIGDQVHDDVFLLGGGGMGALVKAVAFKARRDRCGISVAQLQ
jgi:hypothetical protein